eukprot:CAMPEP_0206295676 /NCGR_PEP_ID=MMETSP0106_2-20121207/5286_1 /ASSEMBLY_ACC=CAM_ASM_000206 /TAXON_ID=81532 /ORGANISM="Acanthoeca-like sp., Strain 10tr" /LENGTH=37 /DNA_ID= /DNA_START= /DNA_END= /DNA_ORIENTATION=
MSTVSPRECTCRSEHSLAQPAVAEASAGQDPQRTVQK